MGYPDDVVLHRGVELGEVDFLPKPFTPRELVNAIRTALDRPDE